MEKKYLFKCQNLIFFIRAKIKNIEATEEAKQKLLQERLRKKDGPSLFVPTNMAVNFVQHNRCKYFSDRIMVFIEYKGSIRLLLRFTGMSQILNKILSN